MREPQELQAGQLRQAALRLIEMGAESGWRGPDPYDALFTPWPSFLVAGRRRRQALIQAHARSPIDIRRLYRRRHSLVPKAPALLGQAAVRLWRAEPEPHTRALAEDALETLATDVTAGHDAWGYSWATQTRWSYYPARSPNVVATAFAANALAEGADTFDRPEWRDRAERAATWVVDCLFLSRGGYFAYHQQSDHLIHNANLLGAALVYTLARDAAGAREAVGAATSHTLDAQRDDGTWPYGEGPGLKWADSFHTGYVLDSLRRLDGVDPRIPGAIERGTRAYLTHFFDGKGRAHLWRDRGHPEDSHSAGTGLTVLSFLAELGVAPSSAIAPVARRTLTHLIDRSGRVVFRRGRWVASRVHYLRWCDAPVALGLASAALVLDEIEAPLTSGAR